MIQLAGLAASYSLADKKKNFLVHQLGQDYFPRQRIIKGMSHFHVAKLQIQKDLFVKRFIPFFLAVALSPGISVAQELSLRVLGQPVGSGLIQQQAEQPFFADFAKKSGLDANVTYSPVDVAGLPDVEGLRILKTGLFDIVSLRGSQVSRDAPIMLGFDLIGLNPTYEAARQHTDAFLDVTDDRLQEIFNAKLLGVWPAGPQVLFCEPEISGLDDLQGLKVRVGDQSAANFVSSLGATGIPMPFGEVQQSLARGVVDCAITGPSSANSAGWPEAVTTVLPIALQMAVNGYAINLDTWNKMSTDQQQKLHGAIDELVDEIWVLSEELYIDAMNCNTGQKPCERGTPYDLVEADVTAADLQKLADTLTSTSLPIWATHCNAAMDGCEQSWRETVGKQLGL